MAIREEKEQEILELLNGLAGMESPRRVKSYFSRIKKLIEELPKTEYKAKGKLDWHAALEFMESAKVSLEALADDIIKTPGQIEMDEERQGRFAAFAKQLIALRLELGQLRKILARAL